MERVAAENKLPSPRRNEGREAAHTAQSFTSECCAVSAVSAARRLKLFNKLKQVKQNVNLYSALS